MIIIACIGNPFIQTRTLIPESLEGHYNQMTAGFLVDLDDVLIGLFYVLLMPSSNLHADSVVNSVVFSLSKIILK